MTAKYAILRDADEILLTVNGKEETMFDYSSAFKYHDEKLSYTSAFSFRDVDNKNEFEDEALSSSILYKICESIIIGVSFCFFIITAPVTIFFYLKNTAKHERMLVFRLGRIQPPKGPGKVLLLPFIDTWKKIDLRMKAFSVPPQQFIVVDGAVIEIGAEIQFRITNITTSALNIKDTDYCLRTLGKAVIINLLSHKSVRQIEKEKKFIAIELVDLLNKTAERWGLEIARIDLSPLKILKESDPPNSLQPLLNALTGINVPNLSNLNKINTAASDSSEDKSLEKIVQQIVQEATDSGVIPNTTCTFKLEIIGKEKQMYYITFINGAGNVMQGDLGMEPDLSITVQEDTFQSILSGSIAPIQAYIEGNLRVTGNTQLLMQFNKILQIQKPLQEKNIFTV